MIIRNITGLLLREKMSRGSCNFPAHGCPMPDSAEIMKTDLNFAPTFQTKVFIFAGESYLQGAVMQLMKYVLLKAILMMLLVKRQGHEACVDSRTLLRRFS